MVPKSGRSSHPTSTDAWGNNVVKGTYLKACHHLLPVRSSQILNNLPYVVYAGGTTTLTQVSTKVLGQQKRTRHCVESTCDSATGACVCVIDNSSSLHLTRLDYLYLDGPRLPKVSPEGQITPSRTDGIPQ